MCSHVDKYSSQPGQVYYNAQILLEWLLYDLVNTCCRRRCCCYFVCCCRCCYRSCCYWWCCCLMLLSKLLHCMVKQDMNFLTYTYITCKWVWPRLLHSRWVSMQWYTCRLGRQPWLHDIHLPKLPGQLWQVSTSYYN